MKFPKLIKDEDFVDESKHGRKVYRYKLDWTELGEFKKNKQIERYKTYHTDFLTKSQKRIFFNDIIPTLDWNDWLRSTKYQYILDKFEYVYIPESYYTEMKHFEKLALNELDRKRPFDTSVRERCLEVAKKSIDSYFYMIMDAYFIYSSGFIDCEPTDTDKKKYSLYMSRELEMLGPLYKYIFWKNQTGGGLVISHAFSAMHTTNMSRDFMIKLQQDLTDNNSKTIFGCASYEQKETLLKLIKKAERNSKIKTLLDDK